MHAVLINSITHCKTLKSEVSLRIEVELTDFNLSNKKVKKSKWKSNEVECEH